MAVANYSNPLRSPNPPYVWELKVLDAGDEQSSIALTNNNPPWSVKPLMARTPPSTAANPNSSKWSSYSNWSSIPSAFAAFLAAWVSSHTWYQYWTWQRK